MVALPFAAVAHRDVTDQLRRVPDGQTFGLCHDIA
jgi:hypothetical protein